MFNTTITTTPFSTIYAGKLFDNIYIGDKPTCIREDMSLESTLRAIVSKRLPKAPDLDDVFCDRREFALNASVFVKRAASYSRDIPALNYIRDTNRLIICDLQMASSEYMDFIKNEFIVKAGAIGHDGAYERLDAITDLFKPITNVVCFLNKVQKMTCIYIKDMDSGIFHALQATIPRILPWYFENGADLTEIEKKLLKSLFTESTPDLYLQCLDEIASGMNIRETAIKSMLGNFNTVVESRQLNEAKRRIMEINNEINSYSRTIADELNERRRLEVVVIGAEKKISEDDTGEELTDYFISNKALSISSFDEYGLTFDVCSDVEYFNAENAESVIDNDRSYAYKKYDNALITKNGMKRLMKAIFIEQELKIKFCARYKIEFGGRVNAIQEDISYDHPDYMTNPHIRYHACMGDYRMVINEMLINNDIIGAIGQCIASCKSLNFGDVTVMGEFMRDVYTGRTKFIELPDGTVVTAVEAIKYLADKANKNNADPEDADRNNESQEV